MSRKITLILASIALVAIGAFTMLKSDNQTQAISAISNSTEMAQSVEKSTAVQSTATDGSDIQVIDMTEGDPDAPITLIEYASFTCPHCKNFHTDVYPDLKKNFIDTGKVKMVFREVYFDRLGLWAGLIARCGGEEKYFGMTDLLFKRQSEWSRGEGGAEIAQSLYKIGRIAGMNDEQMESCLQNKEHAEALVAEFQTRTQADDINATPSFIINGKKHSNMSYPELEKILNELGE